MPLRGGNILLLPTHWVLLLCGMGFFATLLFTQKSGREKGALGVRVGSLGSLGRAAINSSLRSSNTSPLYPRTRKPRA
ncbi:hypothetical protein A3I40_02050 [Candidatus Uhrbacteria bacterium RIFCSPLOWO2_02_FULL_48_12]|uniref:Uncharacterized protein n=1 Tax=Candidatus Uhrbacteria bacterium RIFCSPLOWO2_02_FULL_48_12 TaxID=1802407 RepID=A0A1F7V9M5_9BACT|nr:MAG: hypothetical protein A3I40_02050 [Candidatus Uhrbacteria bacterium RIFCSPLOWO2_02_FULL_48_12]